MDNQVGVINGLLVSITGTVLLVLGVIQCIKRSKKTRHIYSDEETQTRNYKPTSHRIKTDDFERQYNNLVRRNNHLMSAEFEELQQRKIQFSREESQDEENRSKNRFSHNFVYDHSRVNLRRPNAEASDYINACWVPGLRGKRNYIATQYPIKATRNDFWRMVLENECTTLVFLQNLSSTDASIEPYEKCWPGDGEVLTCGDIKLEGLTTTCSEVMAMSELYMSGIDAEKCLITVYHFLAMGDKLVEASHDNFVKFVYTVRTNLPNKNDTIVVSCCSGSSASPIYIATDRLMQLVKNPHIKEVDIFAIVQEMRWYRTHVVRTLEHYLFIHTCVLKMINGKAYESLLSVGRHSLPVYSELPLSVGKSVDEAAFELEDGQYLTSIALLDSVLEQQSIITGGKSEQGYSTCEEVEEQMTGSYVQNQNATECVDCDLPVEISMEEGVQNENTTECVVYNIPAKTSRVESVQNENTTECVVHKVPEDTPRAESLYSGVFAKSENTGDNRDSTDHASNISSRVSNPSSKSSTSQI